jgi:hypothetical protein
MSKCWGATGLTGGGIGDLDVIDGDSLTAGDIALVVTNDSFYSYMLENDGAAESEPDVIAPDTNAANLRWKLRSIAGVSDSKNFSLQPWWATALTGGAANALDGIDGDDITGDSDTALVLDITNLKKYSYAYKTGHTGDSEDSPIFIKPDVNPAAASGWDLMSVISGSAMEIEYPFDSTTTGGSITFNPATGQTANVITSDTSRLTITDAGNTVFSTLVNGLRIGDGNVTSDFRITDSDSYIDAAQDFIVTSSYQTTDFYPVRNEDDGYLLNDTTLITTGDFVRTDSAGSAFVRMDGIKIAPGAEIISATLTIQATNTNGGVSENRWRLSDEVDATAPTSVDEYNAITFGSESLTWELPAFVDNTKYTSADISAMIQEAVDRSGWSYNNAIMFMTDYTGGEPTAPTRYTDSYDQNGGPGSWELSLAYIQGTTPALDFFDKSLANSITFSNSYKTASNATAAHGNALGIAGITSTKAYWEVEITDFGTDIYIGVGHNTMNLANYLGRNADSWGYIGSIGATITNNSYNLGYGDTFTTGDIISVAVDMSAGKIWWGKDGVWQDSGDPAAGTGAPYSNLTGTVYPVVYVRGDGAGGTSEAIIHFDSSDWSYSAPTDFGSVTTAPDVKTTVIHGVGLGSVQLYYNNTKEASTEDGYLKATNGFTIASEQTITAFTGADTNLVSGTAGTDTYYAAWNADGDLINGSGVPYYVGGPDVALADGGTGESLSDPNADSILFYDDSDEAVEWLTPDGTSLEISVNTLQVVANGIDDTHIDWGTGANQVSAVDLPIADAGSYYDGTEVETVLQTIGQEKLQHVLTGFEDQTKVALSSDGGTPPTITLTFTGTVAWWSDGIRAILIQVLIILQ